MSNPDVDKLIKHGKEASDKIDAYKKGEKRIMLDLLMEIEKEILLNPETNVLDLISKMKSAIISK